MIIYLTFYSVYELVFYHVAIGELRFSFFPNFDDFLMTWFLSNFLDDFKFKAKREN